MARLEACVSYQDSGKGASTMGKQHRGKGIRHLLRGGRGTCPVCGTTAIKVLYDRTTADGAKIKVCKRCRKKAV
jgi:hypothetical protein